FLAKPKKISSPRPPPRAPVAARALERPPPQRGLEPRRDPPPNRRQRRPAARPAGRFDAKLDPAKHLDLFCPGARGSMIGPAILLALAAGSAAARFIVPAGAAIVEVVTAADWSQAGLGPRRATLLARGVYIAVAAGLAAQPLGALLAAGLVARKALVRSA